MLPQVNSQMIGAGQEYAKVTHTVPWPKWRRLCYLMTKPTLTSRRFLYSIHRDTTSFFSLQYLGIATPNHRIFCKKKKNLHHNLRCTCAYKLWASKCVSKWRMMKIALSEPYFPSAYIYIYKKRGFWINLKIYSSDLLISKPWYHLLHFNWLIFTAVIAKFINMQHYRDFTEWYHNNILTIISQLSIYEIIIKHLLTLSWLSPLILVH